MTAAAERAGAGRLYIPEYELLAGRMACEIPPLEPTDAYNIVVEEALSRYLDPKEMHQPTAFSAATIGRWLEAPEPPAAVFLVGAYKLWTGERSTVEKVRHAGMTAAETGLKATALAFDAIGKTPVVGGVPRTIGALLAVGEYGVQGSDNANQDKLFRGAMRWVPEWISYNNNPDMHTGPEERSVAAWLLAQALVRLCDQGEVRPGCEPLAEIVIDRLLDLYVQKIRVGIPDKPNEAPPGYELILLCKRLNAHQDTGVTVKQFVADIEATRDSRAIAAKKALHIKRPTSEPAPEILRQATKQSRQYNQLLRFPVPDLASLIENASAQLETANEENHELLDWLTLLHIVAWERSTYAPKKNAEGEAFAELYRDIQIRHGYDLILHLFNQLQAIENGYASLGLQKYASHVLYDQQFSGASRRDIENALYAASRIWYRQSTEYYTAREYKQKSRSSKYATYVSTNFRMPPFSEAVGMRRQIGEVLISAYLYHLSKLGRTDTDPFAKLQLKDLQAQLPKNRHERVIVMHELPPACVRLFEK